MPYVSAAERRTQLVAAARRAMERDGVAATSLRVVAAEAEVPLGTLQYVFPSKDLLLRAVIEDVVDEIAQLLSQAVDVHAGLEAAIRQGLESFWDHLVVGQVNAQLMQAELLHYALRTPGQEDMARYQYERYAEVVTTWGRTAADNAGETSAVPFDRLARVVLASVDGLILQYASDPDAERGRGDLETVIEMVLAVAQIRSDTV